MLAFCRHAVCDLQLEVLLNTYLALVPAVVPEVSVPEVSVLLGLVLVWETNKTKNT